LSVSAYQSALQFNPYHPWEESLLYRVARSAYHAGDYDTAIESIRRLIGSAEKDEEPVSDYRIYSLLANALYAQQQYPQAADAYAHALRLAPPNAEALPTLQQYHRLALNISSKVTS
jgi:tetratricopeptide (TPR) repeat protein